MLSKEIREDISVISMRLIMAGCIIGSMFIMCLWSISTEYYGITLVCWLLCMIGIWGASYNHNNLMNIIDHIHVNYASIKSPKGMGFGISGTKGVDRGS